MKSLEAAVAGTSLLDQVSALSRREHTVTTLLRELLAAYKAAAGEERENPQHATLLAKCEAAVAP